jgi:hypothetical protein
MNALLARFRFRYDLALLAADRDFPRIGEVVQPAIRGGA